MAKKFIIFVIIILAAGGGYLYYKKEVKAPAQAPGTNQTMNQTNTAIPTGIEEPMTPVTDEAAPSPSTTNSAGGQYSNGEQSTDGNNIQVVEVDFDGKQFTPATTNIHVGDWVFFKNKSTEDFWPASNPHPTHTDYPGFDAMKAIAPGGEYKFQFTKVGNWGFHDHLDPTIHGTIVVTQ